MHTSTCCGIVAEPFSSLNVTSVVPWECFSAESHSPSSGSILDLSIASRSWREGKPYIAKNTFENTTRTYFTLQETMDLQNQISIAITILIMHWLAYANIHSDDSQKKFGCKKKLAVDWCFHFPWKQFKIKRQTYQLSISRNLAKKCVGFRWKIITTLLWMRVKGKFMFLPSRAKYSK